MAILHFNLDNKKYTMEFLPDNQAKIRQLDIKNKFIIVQYFSDTKVQRLLKHIKSLDFSSCMIKHYVH